MRIARTRGRSRRGSFESAKNPDRFIPELIVRDGPGALDFYKSVFGAEEVHRMKKPGSEKLVHGELILDGHRLFVCDEFPASEGGTCKSPETLGGTGVRITVLADDADRIVARAVAAGARRVPKRLRPRPTNSSRSGNNQNVESCDGCGAGMMVV